MDAPVSTKKEYEALLFVVNLIEQLLPLVKMKCLGPKKLQLIVHVFL